MNTLAGVLLMHLDDPADALRVLTVMCSPWEHRYGMYGVFADGQNTLHMRLFQVLCTVCCPQLFALNCLPVSTVCLSRLTQATVP